MFSLFETQELVDAIVKAMDPTKEILKVLNSSQFPKLYDSINEHIKDLKVNEGDWGKIASVFPAKIFERSGGPLAQKRPVETASTTASEDIEEFVTIYLKNNKKLSVEEFYELEKLLGRELGEGHDYINVHTTDPAIIEKAKQFIGEEFIDEVATSSVVPFCRETSLRKEIRAKLEARRIVCRRNVLTSSSKTIPEVEKDLESFFKGLTRSTADYVQVYQFGMSDVFEQYPDLSPDRVNVLALDAGLTVVDSVEAVHQNLDTSKTYVVMTENDLIVPTPVNANFFAQEALKNDFNGKVAKLKKHLPKIFKALMRSDIADRMQGGINDFEKLQTSDGKTVWFIDTPGHGWYLDEAGNVIGEEDGGFEGDYAKYNEERQAMHTASIQADSSTPYTRIWTVKDFDTQWSFDELMDFLDKVKAETGLDVGWEDDGYFALLTEDQNAIDKFIAMLGEDRIHKVEAQAKANAIKASTFSFSDPESQLNALKEFFQWAYEGRVENDANDSMFDPEMMGHNVEDQLTGISGEINGERSDDIFKKLTESLSEQQIRDAAQEAVPALDSLDNGWAYYDAAQYKQDVETLMSKKPVESAKKMSFEELVHQAANAKKDKHLTIKDLKLDVNGQEWTAYGVNIAPQELLFECAEGAATYVIDVYGERPVAELFDWEEDKEATGKAQASAQPKGHVVMREGDYFVETDAGKRFHIVDRNIAQLLLHEGEVAFEINENDEAVDLIPVSELEVEEGNDIRKEFLNLTHDHDNDEYINYTESAESVDWAEQELFNVSMTYSVIDPAGEAIKNGEYEETDFEWEDKKMSANDIVKVLENEIGYYENLHPGTHMSLYGTDPVMNYQTGTETYYALHIEGSEADMQKLYEILQDSDRVSAASADNKLIRLDTETNENKVYAAGEADQDYDTATFDKICEELKKDGFQCSHREFDKYQGIYLDVTKVGKTIRYWVADYFVTGDSVPNAAKYREAFLIGPNGDRSSANRGDYFQMDDAEVFTDTTLILIDQQGSETEIENPKKSDLPDLTDVSNQVEFAGDPDEVYVLEPEGMGEEEDPVLVTVFSTGEVNVEDLKDDANQRMGAPVEVEGSTFMVKADRFLDEINKNFGIEDKIVKRAAKVANRGHYLDRIIGIAKVIKSKFLPNLESLKDLHDKMNSKPQGLDQVLTGIGNFILYQMIDDGWSMDQLKEIAYGLPYETLELYNLQDLLRSSGDGNETPPPKEFQ